MDNDTDIDYEKMLPIAYKYLNKFLGILCDDNNIGCKEWNLFTISFYRTENGEFAYDNPGVIGTGKKPIVTNLKFYPFVLEDEIDKVCAGVVKILK